MRANLFTADSSGLASDFDAGSFEGFLEMVGGEALRIRHSAGDLKSRLSQRHGAAQMNDIRALPAVDHHTIPRVGGPGDGFINAADTGHLRKRSEKLGRVSNGGSCAESGREAVVLQIQSGHRASKNRHKWSREKAARPPARDL